MKNTSPITIPCKIQRPIFSTEYVEDELLLIYDRDQKYINLQISIEKELYYNLFPENSDIYKAYVLVDLVEVTEDAAEVQCITLIDEIQYYAYEYK